MPYASLPQRGLIRVSGEDALPFLQGLVSNDVRPLEKGQAVYAALLSPQGRFLHELFLLPWQGAVFLDTDATRLPELTQRLKAYRLRSKVEIEAVTEMEVVAAWEQDSRARSQGSGMFSDPRLSELGYRAIGQSIDLGPGREDEEAYERHRLELGVPDGKDMIAEKSLLMEFGFEDLHGVDFNKGCYVGQEVTARSKHRGQVRRFIYQVHSGSDDLPPSGMPVIRTGAAIGEMRSSIGNIGLALLRVEEVEKGGEFQTGAMPIKASLPQWVRQKPVAVAVEGV